MAAMSMRPASTHIVRVLPGTMYGSAQLMFIPVVSPSPMCSCTVLYCPTSLRGRVVPEPFDEAAQGITASLLSSPAS